jgi:hypothetical protein
MKAASGAVELVSIQQARLNNNFSLSTLQYACAYKASLGMRGGMRGKYELMYRALMY